jgi:UDP-glucose 4-epimerase
VKGPRRAGDPPVLVASSDKARRELGWKPTRERLDVIVESAWRWKSATR